MRLKALIEGSYEYGKAVIYQGLDDTETFLFFYNNADDINCATDAIYSTVEQAQAYASKDFNIKFSDWQNLPDVPYIDWGMDWDLSEIRDVEEFFTESLNQATSEALQSVNDSLRTGDVITALKIYRAKVGVTLDEAKRAVDYLRIKMYR
jgi:hypothetical protein